jgi:hypothetical protein
MSTNEIRAFSGILSSLLERLAELDKQVDSLSYDTLPSAKEFEPEYTEYIRTDEDIRNKRNKVYETVNGFTTSYRPQIVSSFNTLSASAGSEVRIRFSGPLITETATALHPAVMALKADIKTCITHLTEVETGLSTFDTDENKEAIIKGVFDDVLQIRLAIDKVAVNAEALATHKTLTRYELTERFP